MFKWISQAQESYDTSRIAACETVDLRKLKGTLYPEPVYYFDEHSSGGPRVNAWGEQCKTAEGSPILGICFLPQWFVIENSVNVNQKCRKIL